MNCHFIFCYTQWAVFVFYNDLQLELFTVFPAAVTGLSQGVSARGCLSSRPWLCGHSPFSPFPFPHSPVYLPGSQVSTQVSIYCVLTWFHFLPASPSWICHLLALKPLTSPFLSTSWVCILSSWKRHSEPWLLPAFTWGRGEKRIKFIDVGGHHHKRRENRSATDVGSGAPAAWVWWPAPPPTGCVALSKLLNFSLPQFPHL